ncbi:MAG: Ig-like domain-containing protein [Alkalilacustris sp.]
MTRTAEAARRARRVALPALVGAAMVAAVASAQERETLRIAPPDPRPEPAAQEPRANSRAVQWTLTATGDWAVEMAGRATAQLNGDLVRVELHPEEGASPILFHVLAEPDALSHVGFSQTVQPPANAAGIGARGSNYLTAAGREIPSLRGNDGDPGALVNHDGFVRVDRREGRLLILFRANAVHCVGRTEPPFTSLPPCDGPMFLASRPAGQARVTGCIAATEDLEADPGACALPLQIDRVTPPPDRENVALADPGLRVTFSEPVDVGTLGRSFLLHSMGADGQPMPVSGAWERDGPARYVFRPDEDLRSGTRYRAEIAAGADTVLSEDRSAALEEGRDWRFSTWLAFELQRPDGPDAAAIRLHHHQVNRDGPLTRDKPTLTRAWFDWQPHDDIAPDWQPKSFRMDVTLSEDAPRWQGQNSLGPWRGALRI